VNFHGDIRPLSFVFVESLAHLAVNMATIMSYAAETSTILTFLATLPAARVLAQARQEAPEASCTSRAACQTEGGPQPRPLMYPRSPVTRWPGFPVSGPGIGDGRLRDDPPPLRGQPRVADSLRAIPGGAEGRRRPDDSG